MSLCTHKRNKYLKIEALLQIEEQPSFHRMKQEAVMLSGGSIFSK
jgi:hypothetical protein